MRSAQQPSDEVLFAAYVKGDTQAFAELFRRYGPIIRRMMSRQIYRPIDVEELVQDTFMHLHRSSKDFRQGEPLRPWLMTIALNLKREYFRKKARRPEAELELDGRKDPSVVQPDVLATRDAKRHIGRALDSLPDNQREVITLHWFAGLPFAEIAKMVGASTSAVKVRAHRGYKRMRTMLEGEV